MTELDELDITELLTLWKDITESLKDLKDKETKIRDKIKIYLKEREWDSYNDKDTKINVSLSKYETETVDKEALKNILSGSNYAKVVTIKTHEKMLITTKQARERMKRFIR